MVSEFGDTGSNYTLHQTGLGLGALIEGVRGVARLGCIDVGEGDGL